NFHEAIDQMHKKLGANAAAIQLPCFKNDELIGMIDLIKDKLILYNDGSGTEYEVVEVPGESRKDINKYHGIMVEKIAEADEEIMDKFVHGEIITAEDITKAIRRAVLANKFVPVLCGASLKNRGIQPLLDAVCEYLPSPKDVPPIKGMNPDTNEYEEIAAFDKGPLCALCFKVATNPYVGKLNFVRMYSGTLKSGEYIYNASKGTRERVTKLVRMHANRQEIIEQLYAGDIAAAVGLKDTKTGDTLCLESKPFLIESMHFPEPVIQQAIEPKTKQDQEKLGFALHKIAEEDPSFRINYNQETGETIISGMGQLHLDIVIDRIMREFNVEAQVGSPQVAYRETVTKKVVITGKFIQQSGGRGQYGHVVIQMEPQEVPGTGITFENKIKSGAIPREYIPSVEDGVLGAAKSGVLSGYPVTDTKVTLIDGSFHEVDSSEMAFQMAGAIAFNDGLKKAGAILLEPIMDMEITVPEEYMGTVIGDLSARRAKIISLNTRANIRAIRTYIPLAEIFNYATALRSLTQGRASYTMEPSFYTEVPSHITERITAGFTATGTRRV
ncbi:MAG: elongation factor G, partial [Candidatus Omnitrophica bacterium]|nr:elongation factor G [Candidatus Omnitrophota bacterium]